MADSSLLRRLKITRIVQETTHAKTFVLEALDGWQPEYRPGQFITLVFRTRHGEKRRSYSMSSSSVLNEPLSITVKKVDNGEFSRYMLENLKAGDILVTSGINGMFTLPGKIGEDQEFCFLAAGSGIVPCFSLIRTILATTTNKVTLIYSNKDQEETIFYKDLLELKANYPSRFTNRFLFSTTNDVYQKRLSKWLLEHILAEYHKKDLENTLFYLCGPFDYMQTIEITLRVYTGKENILKENFSSLPRLILPEPPDKMEHKVTIHINGKIHTLRVKFPKSILATAKERGIELPYSCEAGRCSSCVASCTQGRVWMAYNEVLVDKEVEKGRILVCQGFPVGGDAEIVYDN